MLGERDPGAFIYPGYIERTHRRGLYGCAIDLFIKGTALEEDTVGYPHRLSPQYTVSSPLLSARLRSLFSMLYE